MQKSKKMGVIQLTTLTAINMMGSGIILLPANLASIGTISIFGWILAALGATLLAYAFSICGMFSRKGGGMGGYAEYRFGIRGNFVANFTYAISLVIANIAIATGVVSYMTYVCLLQVPAWSPSLCLCPLPPSASSGLRQQASFPPWESAAYSPPLVD